MSESIHSDYSKRMSRVFDYIDAHLDVTLSLDTVSKIAFFSPYHFHRVFKFITGEPLNAYITRRKIEGSAIDLLHHQKSISEIALHYGFSEVSSYSRTFKKYFGQSPTAFKKDHPNKHSKIRQINSKIGQAYPNREEYICIVNNLKQWTTMNASIKIKDMPELSGAAVTHIGVQGIDTAFEKLFKWAIPKGLMEREESKFGRVFYDSFKVSAPDKVRMKIILITEEPVAPSEEHITSFRIKPSKCIVGRFEITEAEFEKAWTSLFIWMNEQGYAKSKEQPFEIYQNDYRSHPEQKFIVDLCIPIE